MTCRLRWRQREDTIHAPAHTPRAAPLQLLADRSFRQVWIVGALAGTMRWLDTLAVGVYVLQVTGSALLVAVTLFLRTVPMLLFGVLMGAVAERFDRRNLLLASLGLLAVVNALLAWLAYTDRLQLWQLAIGVFLSGLYWTVELPTRRTLVADIAGIDRIAAAMGLEFSTSNLTRMIGPFVGGLLFELFALPGTLLLGAILYAIATLQLLRLTSAGPLPDSGGTGLMSTIMGGLAFMRASRTIVAILVITVCLNLFGFSYISMVPVIARDVLGLSPFPTGVLMSAEGFGALAGSLWVAFYAKPSRFHQIYFGGAVLFLVGILIFSLSDAFWLSLPTLLLGGLGIAGFAAMQSALIIAYAPTELRNRAMGVLTMCIGVGPIGVLIVGILAEQLGAATATLISSAIGCASMVACGLAWPDMTRRR